MPIVEVEDFKKYYKKSWDDIRGTEDNWKNKLQIWVRWVGPDNSQFHNQRSEWSRKNPIQFFKNNWEKINFQRTVFLNAWDEPVGISRKELETDIQFWLKYRKQDFQVSIEDPYQRAESRAKDMASRDKNLEVLGFNVLTNPNRITKQEIIEEAEKRGWDPKWDSPRDVVKHVLIEWFVLQAENAKEEILKL